MDLGHFQNWWNNFFNFYKKAQVKKIKKWNFLEIKENVTILCCKIKKYANFYYVRPHSLSQPKNKITKIYYTYKIYNMYKIWFKFILYTWDMLKLTFKINEITFPIFRKRHNWEK